MNSTTASSSAFEIARHVREQTPQEGLFAGQDWRVATAPFRLGEELAGEIESLGRVLLQFYRAVNLLYRQSVAGKQPSWIAAALDQGKPAELIQLQRNDRFKNEMPRVIRPDLILNESGCCMSELDSVPGGIGLTAWLNRTYSSAPNGLPPVIGGADGMLKGFAGIFGEARQVHIVISEESQTYRPEMVWLAGQLGERFKVRTASFDDFHSGDAIYRFFELFDLANVPDAQKIFELALAGQVRLTPPPRPLFEEKLLFALLWNRNLREFWRQELGGRFLERMQAMTPYTWLVDPAPIPPQAAIPELNLTDWRQLKALSQRERQLILKVSGFSEKAWGARGVFLGSDLSAADWSAAVDRALQSFAKSPFVLQRYHKPRLTEIEWFDFEKREAVLMNGRARLCPYYFVSGEGDNARAHLAGVLATVCPADKKIIHGMSAAVLAPCAI